MSISIMSVTLRVMHHTLVPAEMTAETGVEPTHSHVKGDPLMGPSEEQRGVFSEGLWSRGSSLGASEPIAKHIEQLLTLTQPGAELFRRIKRDGGRVDILVGASISDANGGLRLDSTVLERLGESGIDLDFDLYSD